MSATTTGGRALYPVLKDFALKAVALGLDRGSRILVTVAAASVIGEAAFGVFVFASTLTAILALATDLGLGVWTTRALARGDGDASTVVRTGLYVRAVASVPYAAAVGVAAASLHGEARLALVLLGVAAACNGLSDHFGAIFRGAGRFSTETRLNAARAAFTLAAGAVVLTVGRSLVGLTAALAVASALGFALGAVSVALLFPRTRATAGAPWRSLARAALAESWPIWAAGLLSLFYFKMDTFFVKAFAGDAELGAYGAAYKLFEGAALLPSVVLAATFPRLARLRDDPEAQRRAELRVAGALLGLGVAAASACYLGRELLVTTFFGAAFARAAESLRWLALGLPLVFLNFGLTHFLIARDRERVNLWLALMMLIVTLGLDAWLIPGGGGPGAAIATGAAEVALTVACLAALARHGRE